MRRLLAVVVAVGAVVLTASPASGHALLRRSDPANGAELASSPRQISVDFSERPDPAVSLIRLFDSAGGAVPTGAVHSVAGAPRSLATELTAPLPDDVYTVTWRTVSREDGHVSGGTFAFGVGRPAPPAAGASSSQGRSSTPSGGEIAGRWLLYAGLSLLMGAALSALVVRRTPPPAWPLVAAGAVAAVAGSALTMLAEQHVVGVGLRTYLASGHGRLLVRETALCAVAAVAAVACFARSRRSTYAVLGVAAALALGAHAVTGHAGAAEHLRWPTIGVQWLHLLAVAAWIGSLAWAVVALPSAPQEREAAARRLSRLATVAVVVVAATGAARAIAEVSSWRALWSTGFGRAVLAKVAVFALLLLLGARNKYRLVPAAVTPEPARQLRRAVGVEVGFGGVVFALSGLLAGLAPATGLANTTAAKPVPPVVTQGADYATSVRVRLTVTPGGVGPNRFSADVTDYDTGRAMPARRVALRFSVPGRPELRTSTLELAQTPGTPTWAASGPQLSVEGRWHVVAVVDAGAAGVEVPLDLTTAPPPQTLRVDRAPGQPTVYTATLPDGSSGQIYLQPETAGFTQIHVTCFDPAGGEHQVSALSVTATTADRTAAATVRRFGPGHFVADATLAAGRWRVGFRAVTADGRVLRGYADVDVQPKAGAP